MRDIHTKYGYYIIRIAKKSRKQMKYKEKRKIKRRAKLLAKKQSLGKKKTVSGFYFESFKEVIVILSIVFY